MLRRELRRLVREKPDCNLIDVREEALMWTLEDCPHSTNAARNRNLVSSSTEEVEEKTKTDLTVTLQEVVKIIAQQGKAIGELTNAVRELTMQQTAPESGTPSTLMMASQYVCGVRGWDIWLDSAPLHVDQEVSLLP